MLEFALPATSSLIVAVLALVAGIIILAFPHIISYVIGVWMVAVGVVGIVGGGWLPGMISIALGIVVLVFPHILSYLVGVYLVLLGLWFIFAGPSLIAGLVTLAVGIIVMVSPDILSYVFGLYLLIGSAIAIARYYGLF